MSAISGLGSGIGLLYYTDKNGNIINTLSNDSDGAIELKVLANASMAPVIGRQAVGEISISAVGTGTLDDVLVNGESQIGETYIYTGKTAAQVATAVAALINQNTARIVNYSAVTGEGKIYLIAPLSAGSDVNGHKIEIIDGGNLTNTTTDVDYGTNNTKLYADQYGYRFFINEDYNSAGVSGEGRAELNSLVNAKEITNEVIPRGFQSGMYKTELEISSGEIKVERESTITNIAIKTEGCADTDTLSTIRPSKFVDYDLVVIRGAEANQVVSVDNSGNITLSSAGTFKTGDKEASMILSYVGGTFYEVCRSTATVPTVAQGRTASLPYAVEGVNTVTMSNSPTSVTIEPGTDEKFTIVDGTPTLSVNWSLVFGTSAPVAGDEFHVHYTAKPVTTSGTYTVTIGGVTLTDDQATTGSQYVYGYYDGSAWQVVVIPQFKGSGNTYQLETAFIKDTGVTVEKLEADLTKEVVIVPVSFETSEVGDMKLEMNYPGTVNEIHVAVSKAIESTDDATITPKNNAGTTMTSGTVTIDGGAAIGRTYVTTPSGNNTFVAGDVLTLTTAKTTAGGKGIVSILVTKS